MLKPSQSSPGSSPDILAIIRVYIKDKLAVKCGIFVGILLLGT